MTRLPCARPIGDHVRRDVVCRTMPSLSSSSVFVARDSSTVMTLSLVFHGVGDDIADGPSLAEMEATCAMPFLVPTLRDIF